MRFESENEGVVLEILFRISPMNRVEFLQTVESLLSATAPTPGLDALSCFEQVGVENAFLWRECWGSLGELESRLQSSGIKTLLGAIGVLGELDQFEVLASSDPGGTRFGWS